MLRDIRNVLRKCLATSTRWLRLLALIALVLALGSQAGDGIHLTKSEISHYGTLYGEMAARRLTAWQQLMVRLAHASTEEKLKGVNNFFNQLQFVSDQIHWHQADYWATPVEFLITDGGDCEDFAIAKYYTLKSIGVPDAKMSLTYVKALRLNQAHMVLTYYPEPNAIPLVLDNLIGEIKTADKRPDLLPVYTFNGEKLWLSKRGKRSQLVGNASRLKPWVKLQSRVNGNKVNIK